MSSTLYVEGDNVRIADTATNPHQTNVRLNGVVKRVYTHCVSGGLLYQIDWQNGETTNEVATNMFNLSRLGEPNA